MPKWKFNWIFLIGDLVISITINDSWARIEAFNCLKAFLLESVILDGVGKHIFKLR